MTRRERLAILSGSAALALTAASAAQAGGFAIREQSAYGQGSSFAGIAAGGSTSSMFWNPATLAGVSVFELETVASGVFINTEVDVLGPEALTVPLPPPLPPLSIPTGAPHDEGDIGQDAVIPAKYAGYRLTDAVVLGIGVNGGFGLVTNYTDDSPLRDFGVSGTSDVFSLNVNPALSIELADWLAVGLGAQIQHIDLRLTNQTLPGTGDTAEISGDDVGFGLTAGVLITPMPGTEIGLGYRSFIDHELDGETEIAGEAEDSSLDGFDLPDIVTFGIRQRITDRFRVMAGAEWSNWSRFEEAHLTFDDVEETLPFEWNDGWFFSLGGEFDVTDRVALRAGIGYELSPLDDENRSYRLPDNDRLWLSAGASFKATDRLSFDLGYSFITAEDSDLLAAEDFGGDGPTANGPFFGEAESQVHVIAVALKVKLGPVSAPEQQIFTK
ncbi:MAG TPA: outer membrane protein transport protein [Propylenella sp.]|nr:outer membrane protein transport protein [Propylenella sp.]